MNVDDWWEPAPSPSHKPNVHLLTTVYIAAQHMHSIWKSPWKAVGPAVGCGGNRYVSRGVIRDTVVLLRKGSFAKRPQENSASETCQSLEAMKAVERLCGKGFSFLGIDNGSIMQKHSPSGEGLVGLTMLTSSRHCISSLSCCRGVLSFCCRAWTCRDHVYVGI